MRIDLHADTPLWQHWMGYDFCRAHKPWLPIGAWLSNLDLPRMAQGGLDCQVFGLVSLPPELDGFATILHMIRRMQQAVEQSQGAFRLVRDGAGLRQAYAQGVRCGMLSIEGVHSLSGRLERAEWLIEQGVVSFGLAHFNSNAACSPAAGLGASQTRGLTAFGRQLVDLLAQRKVLVDLTHINRVGFFETLQAFHGRVFVSHTGVRGVFDHWRNLDDTQIRAVAERGGIMGVIFSRHFLGGDSLEAVVAHIKHLIDVGGTSCAALGSDFDGFIVPVKGLRDVTGLPALAAALLRSGLPASVVDGVMGDNARDFFYAALPEKAGLRP